jgi:ABC-type transport system involved in multi-copper enzyme maturation permease subunit
MTFLPIGERELWVAARRRSTWRVRWWTAGLALVAALFLMQLTGPASTGPGSFLFRGLSLYLFALALAAGVFLTADSLSGERREGTLGLLFLTDLNGTDVVLGKFLACSLNALYGLLAVLPILGLSVLLGGVTGAEFWRMALALVNTLFVALAVGMGVSAFQREAHRAMNTAGALLLLLAAVLPAFEALRAWLGWAPWLRPFTGASPWFAWLFAYEGNYLTDRTRYWTSLAAANALAWLALIVAGWRVRRVGVEEPSADRLETVWQRLRSLLPGTAPRKRAHKPVPMSNPAVWLAERYMHGEMLNWALVALAATIVLGILAIWPDAPLVLVMLCVVYPTMMLMHIVVAADACRVFTNARNSGAIELLLTSPLSSREIVNGLWAALERTFLGPMFALALLHLLAPTFVLFITLGEGTDMDANMGVVLIGGWILLNMIVNFRAAGWLGLWLSLTIRRPQYATGWTVLYTLALPTLTWCVPLLINIFILSWAQQRMSRDIRAVFHHEFEPPKLRRKARPPFRIPPPLTSGPPPLRE